MLHLHRAERADALVAALGDLLVVPPADPFAPEVISVPTRGMERWLTQRLSARLGAQAGRGDGVCANVEFPFPGALVGGALAAASGMDPDDDPWRPERAVWPLLEVVDELAHEPWVAPLAGREDRFASARHVADLFDRYAVHRPQLVCDWAADRIEVPADVEWEARLWRALRERIAQPGPAERLAGDCERLRAEPALVALPERFSIFGLTRLPASYLEVLRALAAAREVHLFLLHPSAGLWERIAGRDGAPPSRRAEDPTRDLAENPLLRSWGQDSRELQLVMERSDEPVDDQHHAPADPPATLLGRIQADVRADRAPAGEPLPGQADARPLLDAADESIRIHSCHGRGRQVEVIRDAILHLLADDPTLEPRDVIVMCPDVEEFAPLVHAAFGTPEALAEEDGGAAAGRDLRVRLADRSIRQTNPLLTVVSLLLDLAARRVTASQVLDLADREPVRRRFRFDDDDIARIQDWVAQAGVRWGLDAGHRKPYRLDGVPRNTWSWGLDRLLLGVTMSEEELRLFGRVLPVDDVESGAIDLAGRLAEMIARLGGALDRLRDAQPIAAWADALAAAADGLTATSERDAWQRTQLQRILDDVAGEAAGSHVALTLTDVRALLAERLRGRPTRANFRTGHLTVCTLVPMRSVPHRIVCVLGLDDGAFPRKGTEDGDDLLLRDPHVGDREPRTEDRQLLLDALLAATEKLVIAFSGHDERSNLPRPPAVPVGELLDTIDRTVRAEHGPARDQVLVQHPLQPFDERNFVAGALTPGRPWGFDPAALAGAQASRGARAEPPPFLSGRLTPPALRAIELEALTAFVGHPVKAFLRRRLEITLSDRQNELDDALPVQLDGLEEWSIGDRVLRARLDGADPDACVAAEIARGALPPGRLGFETYRGIAERVSNLVHAAGPGEPESVRVHLELTGDRVLTGTVTGLVGTCLRKVSYSTLAAKHRLQSWVEFLALAATRPEAPISALVVGRRKNAAAKCTLPAFPGPAAARRQAALAHLELLVDLYERALREPLPLYCRTSAAYAGAAREGRNAEWAARDEWESSWDWDREDREPEHMLVLGEQVPFATLLEAPPLADEAGEGWAEWEASRFGRYALRLWTPLLDHEEGT